MERLFSALGEARRLEVLEALLDDRQLAPGVVDRASQLELRAALGIPETRKGTLKKDLDALAAAGLVSSRGGQHLVAHPEATRTLLAAAAELAWTIDEQRVKAAVDTASASAAAASKWRDLKGRAGTSRNLS